MKTKVMTIVGTRPEIIKLSRVVAELEKHTEHILVHTGQNYDYELNQIFSEFIAQIQNKTMLDEDTDFCIIEIIKFFYRKRTIINDKITEKKSDVYNKYPDNVFLIIVSEVISSFS